MIKFLKSKKQDDIDLTSLKAGDSHYRAYVGPPRDYDLISAMVFNLLTCAGLRQEHRVLDIGCGSLRVGRLLVPYLLQGNYFGVEPNRWLVKDGIKNELGDDQVRLKKPTFSYQASMEEFDQPLNIDFAVAQSIFSHCGLDLIEAWLKDIHPHLSDDGVLLATYVTGDEDFEGEGWIYPGCVEFSAETMEKVAESCGYKFKLIDWAHPRQQWCGFFKNNADSRVSEESLVSWARVVESRYPKS